MAQVCQLLTAFLDVIQPINWLEIPLRLQLELRGRFSLSFFTTYSNSIIQNARAKLGPCQSQALLSITRGCSGRKEVLQLNLRKLEPFLFPQHHQILAFHPPLHASVPSVKQGC